MPLATRIFPRISYDATTTTFANVTRAVIGNLSTNQKTRRCKRSSAKRIPTGTQRLPSRSHRGDRTGSSSNRLTTKRTRFRRQPKSGPGAKVMWHGGLTTNKISTWFRTKMNTKSAKPRTFLSNRYCR